MRSKNGRGIYQLTDDGTALSSREFYVLRMLDGDEATATVYYNATGSWEIEDSRETNITVDEFWSWVPEHADLQMIPFITADSQ